MGPIIGGLFLGILGALGFVVYAAWHNDMNEYAIKDGKKTKKLPHKGWMITSIVVFTFLGAAIASATSVPTGEIAVMTRFGKVTGQELTAGFHLKNPLDHANLYDVKVQKSTANASAASKDLQDVNAEVVLNYHLNQGSVFDIHKNVGINYHSILIDPALQETFKSATAQYNATELIDNRQAVKDKVQDALTKRLAPFGINVDTVSLTNFSFSKEFSDSIEQKQVAQQQAEQAQFNLQKASLDAQANQVQQSALTPQILEQQAIKKWDGKLPNTLAGGGTVFNIPLQ